MPDSPATRPSLLLRVADGHDRAAWEQFVEIYAPLVFQLARRRGLQEADAADVAQEVLSSLATAFRRGKYDPSRGAFRGWLLTIARNEINDALAVRARREQAGGGTAAHQTLAAVAVADDPQADDTAAWQRDYQQRLYGWAAEQVEREVQPATWQAFRRTAIDRESGQDVAAALAMTVAAVYLAKSRVMKRLRELVQEVDAESFGFQGSREARP